MSLEELERRVIREAQRELAPAPAVRERHELALLERLAREVPLGSDASRLGVVGAARPSAARAPWLTGSPARMLGVGMAVGALVGAWVGYSFGRRAEITDGDTVAVEPEARLEPGTRLEPVPDANGTAVQDEPAPAAVAPGPPPALAASASAEHGSGAAGRVARRGPSVAPRASESSLAEELAMLQRARRALGAGNAGLALGIVQELDERFPKGVLIEERIATRVLSLCQLGRGPEARGVAHEFLARHPSSVYAERVRTSCIETPE